MQVLRRQAVEQDDGSLAVVIVVAAKDRAAFFGISPLPNTSLDLLDPVKVSAPVATPAKVEPAVVLGTIENPPTQRVVVTGFDPFRSGLGETELFVARLVQHPPFQQFVAAQPGPHDADSVKASVAFVIAACGGITSITDVQVEQAVLKPYRAWHLTTRGCVDPFLGDRE